jgi:formyl-CoA transferase
VLPLDDIRVLDMTTALSGPLVGQLLGDYGADVIKVEKPGGDGYRGLLHPVGEVALGSNPRFDCANRNKRSLAIDLKSRGGLAVIERLLADWADVLLVNMRPGVPDRMGIGPARCHELNPRLIWASLTGYGETGPWARRQGADIWAQTLGGTVAVQGSPGGEPILGATAFVDHGAPLAVAFGIVAAVHERDRTGRGTIVKSSLLDTTLYMQSSSNLTDYLNGGDLIRKGGRGWAGGFPMGAYTAADGEIVTMLVSDDQWDAFLHLLGLEELRGRPEYDSHPKRVAARHELYPILDQAFSKKTRAEWSALFAETRIIRADPALFYDEVVEHPQVQATGAIITVPHPEVGAVMAISSPVQVGDVRTDVRRGPPLLGEHTREILDEIGYTDLQIEAMFGDQVVFDPAHPEDVTSTRAERERYARDLTRDHKDEEADRS